MSPLRSFAETPARVSQQRLLRIEAGLSEAERELVRLCDRLRLATHSQLARLTAGDSASSASQQRTVRRRLRGLSELGVLARLQRRIGGVRAGSSGHVYYLGPVGQRLIAYWQGNGLVRGRVRPEPGVAFVRHRLAVSDLYVLARQRERAGELELLSFDVEPDCWRSSLDGYGSRMTLKPDAFLRVGVGAYEDRWFVEVDLGTESRPVLARKLQAYLDYYHAGHEQATHGIFPRVLLLTTNETRLNTLVDLCAALPAEYWRLFAAATLTRGVDLIAGGVEAQVGDTAGGPA